MTSARKPYPSDVSDDEWSLVVPYLTLVRKDAPQRQHSLRELFNALRYVVRYRIAAKSFEALAHDLRAVLRLKDGRPAEPAAAIIDSRTLRSTPESGTRAEVGRLAKAIQQATSPTNRRRFSLRGRGRLSSTD
jgi:hypothetical protein